MARKKAQEDFAEQLSKEYGRWQHLYKNGGSDPSWPDGSNMNLVRNHIIYYKHKIEETMPQIGYPEIYYRDLPPEVDNGYMAGADEIRECARASLALYLADPDYQYLYSRIKTMNPKDINKTCITNVLGYATGLAVAIQKDSLIDMRRHRNTEIYLDSFKSCAKKVRELKPPENEQLSFFPHYEHDDDEYDYEDDEMEL